VARVLGAKGLSGAFRVELLTDRPDRLAPGAELYFEGETVARRIAAVERGGRVPVLALEDCTDRESAAALTGRYLEVDQEPLPDGSYYWHQIVGLQVADETGRDLGRVVEVFRVGENEVYRVEGPDGELLLPALRDVVRSIDLAAGRMSVRYEAEEVR
jgi:16S rRNA processing protein RimM